MTAKRIRLAKLFLEIGTLMLEEDAKAAKTPQVVSVKPKTSRPLKPLTERFIGIIRRKGTEGITLARLGTSLGTNSIRPKGEVRRSVLQELLNQRRIVCVESRKFKCNGSGAVRKTFYAAEFQPVLAQSEVIVNLV